ncbi:YceD family protein [Staphylococcus caprae]|uniref:YceD family protein n=1 Tax=Staphylococcus caprae TaxID=29380 RepID=UPI003B228465
MKWSITQLRKYQGKPFEFNQTAHFDHLKESLDLIDLSEINVEGQLTVKSNEVIADMHVTGTYTMPCARTLVPVEVPLDVTTSEVFDLEGYNDYIDSEDQEDEHYHLVSDGMINIKDIAEELVIIEKPMRAFSENSNQMLTEGNGWEVIDEDQLIEVQKEQDNDDSESKQVDPRLQKLQQLYDKEQ